ncbi:hypothetical protein [Pseudoalteromonas obscura]|uniref:Uncharacterized protein n=1 Tax=Pseudoalteromonas obscura TaxID=3048491 RepID=A0ABT7EH89_9GAMM|nr:hypothetical protein [Pseudoalteromonas sp. P94(2023)]MDK2594420.1 hypothetical protein [Pseudoalteromonas sp. P94(2023)]
MKTSKKKLCNAYVLEAQASMSVAGGTNGNGWEPKAKASNKFYDLKIVKP